MTTLIVAPPNRTGLVLDGNTHLEVNAHGTATNTTINSDGLEVVNRDGTAINTTINGGGRLEIEGGTANYTTINGPFGVETVFFGKADFTTVNSGGHLLLGNHALADNTTLNGGHLEVNDGGRAEHTLVLSGGDLVVGDGAPKGVAITRYTTINDGGVEHVNTSGVAKDTTINSGGIEIVNKTGSTSDDAEAVVTTVNKGGLLDIVSGRAITTTINDGGLVTVEAGLLGNTTINSGGTVDAKAGTNVNTLTFGNVDHGVGGLLKLGDPASLKSTVHGPINNWQIGDVIDLVNTNVTSVSETGNGNFTKLTVQYGNNQSVTYQLSGQQKDTHVGFQSDGHGGTDLVLLAGVQPNEPHHLL